MVVVVCRRGCGSIPGAHFTGRLTCLVVYPVHFRRSIRGDPQPPTAPPADLLVACSDFPGSTSWTPDEDFNQLLDARRRKPKTGTRLRAPVDPRPATGMRRCPPWIATWPKPGARGLPSWGHLLVGSLNFEAAKRAVVVVTGKGELRQQFEARELWSLQVIQWKYWGIHWHKASFGPCSLVPSSFAHVVQCCS